MRNTVATPSGQKRDCASLTPAKCDVQSFGGRHHLGDNARQFLEPLMTESIERLSADAVLDASGLNCPEPVMMLHQKIRDLHAGGLLKVIATDPSTQRDIPKFCVFLGHDLIEQNAADGVYLYWIRKKQD
jgi:tRNA 2-thiouridine synthesizing protein A